MYEALALLRLAAAACSRYCSQAENSTEGHRAASAWLLLPCQPLAAWDLAKIAAPNEKVCGRLVCLCVCLFVSGKKKKKKKVHGFVVFVCEWSMLNGNLGNQLSLQHLVHSVLGVSHRSALPAPWMGCSSLRSAGFALTLLLLHLPSGFHSDILT